MSDRDLYDLDLDLEEETAEEEEEKRRLVTWILTGAALLVVGLLAWVFATRFGEDPSEIESPLVGKPAPAWSLERLVGEGTVASEDLEGSVVVINFWSSWCGPCRTEHPNLLAVADAYAEADVQFVGVLYQDSEDAGLRFLAELGSSPYFEYLVDAESRSAIRYGVYGIPETFVVGRDGVIVHKILGPVVDPGQLTEPIEEALAGPS
jgi:cytochrome c biogenesis protein CcmG/thiol:disulfide interchange protein DsbE